MNLAGANKGESRLQLLNQLAGDFTGVIIGTFGADLGFAESQLFGLLSSLTTSRLVLADSRELNKSLAECGRLSKLNRTYVATPVNSPRAHHPKYLLLIGEKSGRLFVGSGNLGVAGYAGTGECFTLYEWNSGASKESALPFGAVRELVDKISERDWIDDFTKSRCRSFWTAASWIPDTGGQSSPVVHNANMPILDQLITRIGNQPVVEIIATAPFHDRQSSVISRLFKELKPEKFRLLVQQGRTRLNKTALQRIIRDHENLELVETSLVSGPATSYIHAKFILIRTRKNDYLLQGSANLSAVALSQMIDGGNVEIANLLQGKIGEFDYLLSSLNLVVIKGGLKDFHADEDWSDEDPTDVGRLAIRDVIWTAPKLQGSVRERKPKTLRILVGKVQVDPIELLWTERGEYWDFCCTFDVIGSEDIDKARGIEIRLDLSAPVLVYPYHATTLNRLVSGQTRVDLLQQAGTLDLAERDLIELVRELERVMIVDRESLWRAANQDSQDQIDSESDESADDPVRLRYEDIDWSRILLLPQMQPYKRLRDGAHWDGGDLSIVLSSLASRLRSSTSSKRFADSDEFNLGDDLSSEPAIEDEDAADQETYDNEDDGSVDEAEPNHSRYRRKTRSIWRRFVRRLVRALKDEEFVKHMGSSVVVPTYIIVNSLCQRLRVKGIVEDETLTTLQLDLWGFMWGKPGETGYLDSLGAEEVKEARRLLTEYGDLPVLIAAVDDAWWWAWEMDDRGVSLRRMWRKILESNHWTPSREFLSIAARLSKYYPGEPDSLGEDLQALAEHVEQHELLRDMAALAEVSLSDIHLSSGKVMVNNEERFVQFLEFSADGVTESQVVTIIGEWMLREPDRDYFRVQSEEFVAFVDTKHRESLYFRRDSALEKPLDVAQRTEPKWQSQLDLLLQQD